MTIICHSLVTGVYLEFLQLVVNVNGQGWIHGLVLADKILKPEKRELCNFTELIFESNLYLCFPQSLPHGEVLKVSQEVTHT